MIFIPLFIGLIVACYFAHKAHEASKAVEEARKGFDSYTITQAMNEFSGNVLIAVLAVLAVAGVRG